MSETILKIGIKLLNQVLQNNFDAVIKRVSKEQPIEMLDFTAKRLLYFYDLFNQISHLEGDIVECGVGWGRSLFMLCMGADLFENKRKLFAFDSFEGFPEPSKEDEPEKYGIKKGRYATSEIAVKQYLINSGITQDFIDHRIVFKKGFFNETLKQYTRKKIALLHLDVDLYQSYKDCLDILYPKVAEGGIIAFDEYRGVNGKAQRRQLMNFSKGKKPFSNLL